MSYLSQNYQICEFNICIHNCPWPLIILYIGWESVARSNIRQWLDEHTHDVCERWENVSRTLWKGNNWERHFDTWAKYQRLDPNDSQLDQHTNNNYYYLYITYRIGQSWDYVFGLMTLVYVPELVWLLCLGLIVLHITALCDVRDDLCWPKSSPIYHRLFSVWFLPMFEMQ